MKTVSLTCICCPRGCSLTVDENFNVTGNSCPRGAIYGKSEVTNPTRIVTSTVVIISKIEKRLPVKTITPIAKGKIFDCMKEINKIVVHAPVHIGDVIIKDVCGSGVNVVSCKNIEE